MRKTTTLVDRNSDERQIIPTEVARSRLAETLRSSIQRGENTLITAPTALGKSYTVASTPWLDLPDVTDGEPVIHISPTRKARDEAAVKSDQAGLNSAVLRGRHDICSVASGDHDEILSTVDGSLPSEWLNWKCDVEHVPFHTAHHELSQVVGELPCEQTGECGGSTQWENIPRNADGEAQHDVIHVTARFAYVTDLIENATVIFDEFPQYQANIHQDTVRRVATRILKSHSDGGYWWEELLVAVQRRDTDRLAEYREILEDTDYPWWQDVSKEVQTLTPKILRAITYAEPNGKNQFVGKCGQLTVVLDDENTIVSVNHPPELSKARCVIGLDAHPSQLRWQLSTGIEYTERSPLTREEMRLWRRHERGLHVVQVGAWERSYTTGWRGNGQQDAEALIQEIHRKHGDAFSTCVCPKSIEHDVRTMMTEGGVKEPQILHYGEEKSRNDFADESVGLVIGCIDPGDSIVQAMLGQLGLRAEPEMYQRDDGEQQRKHGRGFTGPDADAATELLESVRAMGVAQAVGRYARDADDPDSQATVYAWTSTVPDDLVDDYAPGVVGRNAEGKQTIEQVLKESGKPMSKTEVAEVADVSKKHAWEVLNEMVRQDVATVTAGTGKYGADEYRYSDGTLSAVVDLTLIER